MCVKLSFEDFITSTNAKSCGQDPQDIFDFFKRTELWPERVYFNDLDNFLKNTLTWGEYEQLRIQDVSPKYFSFESVCSETNFLDVIKTILGLELSTTLAKVFFEYCQDQNAWPVLLNFSKHSISIDSSKGSSIPSLISPFEPPITSTQDEVQNGKNEADPTNQTSEESSQGSKSGSENSQEKSDDNIISIQDSEISSGKDTKESKTISRKRPLTERNGGNDGPKIQRMGANDLKPIHKRLNDVDIKEEVITPLKKTKRKKAKENMPKPLIAIKIEMDDPQSLEVRNNTYKLWMPLLQFGLW